LFLYTIILITIVYSENNSSNGDFSIKIAERRHATIIWGTEVELINLIKELELEKTSDFDDELLDVLNSLEDGKITESMLDHFSKTKNIGAKKFALTILEDRNNKKSASVISALAYASALKIKEALPFLRDILDSDESRFLSSAARAIGVCGYKDDSVAIFILDYLGKKTPTDVLTADLIFALGEIKSSKSSSFLSSIAESTDEKPTKRMIAIEALGKIAFPDSLNSILRIIQDNDANIRLYCYNALSLFDDKRIENQILHGFRDSYYKIRLVSARLAGERALDVAVPYLIYRTEYDDVPSVKEESIKALGYIVNPSSESFLAEYFTNKTTTEKMKAITADALLKINTTKYIPQIIRAYDDARNNKKKTLQAGLANVITRIIDPSLLDFAKRLINSDDIIERNYGLDISVTNLFGGMMEQIEILSNDKSNMTLALKANKALKAIRANQKSLIPGDSME